CLPNEEIFAGLAQMGYEKPYTKLTFYKAFFSSQWKFLIHTILQSLNAKRTSWNEFSTAMASAVICLSKGQKFNFSKYIFDSLVRNVDSTSKFYMYPRFIQLILQNQVGDFSTHSTRFISPALTQKGMLAARQLTEEGLADAQVQADDAVTAAKLEIIKLKARVKRLEMANKAEKQAEIYHLDLDHPSKVLSMQEDDSDVQEVVEPSIPAVAPTVVAAYIRRRKRVIIRDPEEELSLKTPTETPKLKDKGKGIMVETPKPIKKKDQIELDAEYARKLHEEINRDHEEIKKDID
nr:glutamic acid-rich protein-like [Tanacetum cinerariifolium]